MLNTHTFGINKGNNMFNVKKIAALGLMAVGMTFVGCMEQTGTTASSQDAQPVTMSIRVGLDPVGSLAKASLITLKKLIIVLNSNTGDTIRDTITTSTTPAISGTSTSPQTISKNYTLKPLRIWTVTATTKDLLDTVIHTASVSTGTPINDGDTAHVNLTLSSRFSMYQANFLIPDSISSSVGGDGEAGGEHQPSGSDDRRREQEGLDGEPGPLLREACERGDWL